MNKNEFSCTVKHCLEDRETIDRLFCPVHRDFWKDHCFRVFGGVDALPPELLIISELYEFKNST